MSETTETRDHAMKVAMEFERKHNRNPQDVHQKGLGYDIQSEPLTPSDLPRHIEVKGRGKEKAAHIFLDDGEYQNAKNDPYFWVYAVFGKNDKTRLYILPKDVIVQKAKQVIKWKFQHSWMKEFRQEL